MIKKIFFLGSLVLMSNFFCSQVQIPLNSTDKTSVNKWTIAKFNDSLDIQKLIELKTNMNHQTQNLETNWTLNFPLEKKLKKNQN